MIKGIPPTPPGRRNYRVLTASAAMTTMSIAFIICMAKIHANKNIHLAKLNLSHQLGVTPPFKAQEVARLIARPAVTVMAVSLTGLGLAEVGFRSPYTNSTNSCLWTHRDSL